LLLAARASADPPPDRSRQPIEVVGRELPEWVDPITSSASRLASSCGLTLEARLSGMPQQNFLNLTIANDLDTPAVIDVESVTVRFGSGVTRRLVQVGQGDTVIRPNWWSHRAFSFPSKADFEHEDRLRVEVPLSLPDGKKCLATVDLAHRPNAKVPKQSYTEYSPLEVSLGVNLHFAATGDLQTIAKNVNPGFDVVGTWYPTVHHGISFEFGVDFYGSRGLAAVTPNQSANPINGTLVMLGYSYRLLPIRWFAFEYNLNAGFYGVETRSSDDKEVIASSTSFSVREKLRLNFLLYQFADLTRVEIGPALIHTVIPTGDFGATSVSGNLFSGALYLSVD
jgi:hypothetical protein